MKKSLILIGVLSFMACSQNHDNSISTTQIKSEDSLELVQMIRAREKSMIQKDIEGALSQFAENATWINSQGYYFEGKEAIRKFHGMLAGNDSLDYYYKAGEPRIKILDRDHALAYYSWKMFWYKKAEPTDTTMKEIGLMTLSAQKYKDGWKWVAITNQHTPWFYEKIDPVPID